MPATIDSTPGAAFVPAASKAAERVRSASLDDHAVPQGREEDWRFTPLRALRPLLDGAGPERELSVLWSAEGADVTSLGPDAPEAGRVLVPGDRASAVVAALAPTGTLVRVGPETTGASARLTAHGRGERSYHRLVVEVGRHAEATVVVDHRGSGLLGTTVELDVADGAVLTYVSLHRWDDDAVHAAAHGLRLGRDAKVRHVVVTLGGALVRTTVDVEYAAPGGDADLLGLFFADAGQHLEHRLFVDHAVPHCTSNVEYKGALQGDPDAGAAGVARSVWVGDVLIRAGAVGTSTYEMNRNLLLTDAARADSVPNLEIETGEIVGAGHASATGRFDDEQMFYLQARGIPAEQARRLVVRGFFADLVSRIGVPDVEREVLDALDAELGDVDPLYATDDVDQQTEVPA